jgi:hypothetical protein
MFPDVDEVVAYELLSDFLKDPNNQKQARDLISEAHRYAESQVHQADVSVFARQAEAGVWSVEKVSQYGIRFMPLDQQKAWIDL